jgi:uncharacterized protein
MRPRLVCRDILYFDLHSRNDRARNFQSPPRRRPRRRHSKISHPNRRLPRTPPPNDPFGAWLHIAAKAGHVELVQRLLSLGIDINTKGGTFGGSAINLAAGYRQPAVVKLLLYAGAELDVTESARNPLFSAIQGGHLDIVKLLIERGIDHRISYTGEFMKDMDALAFARERGQLSIVEYLTTMKL